MKDIIKQLSSYKRIIITGPNRTGTTFFSNLLAQELGYDLIDEDVYRYDEGVFKWYFKKSNIVVQGPGMSYMAHSLSREYNDTCVVFMMRDLEDIKKSSQRIRDPGRSFEDRWERFERVLKRYQSDEIIGDQVEQFVPFKEEFDTNSSAKFRYEVWENIQKSLCSSYIELDYEELQSHVSFIAKEKRKDFGPKQTHSNNTKSSLLLGMNRVTAALKYRLIKQLSKSL